MDDIEIMPLRLDGLAWAVRFFTERVYSGDAAAGAAHVADHAAGGGTTPLAKIGSEVAGYVTIRWRSNYPPFARAGIPLIHHLEVFSPFRRRGVASRLLDEAERLIAGRATAAGITVGLFDAYGPAQRLYARRGYLPDGRGACLGQRPIIEGETVTIGHELILWMTKALAIVSEQ